MSEVALLIGRALDAPGDDAALARVRAEVRQLCARFPLYQDRL
jgi:glycine hydroxymethyltransferase